MHVTSPQTTRANEVPRRPASSLRLSLSLPPLSLFEISSYEDKTQCLPLTDWVTDGRTGSITFLLSSPLSLLSFRWEGGKAPGTNVTPLCPSLPPCLHACTASLPLCPLTAPGLFTMGRRWGREEAGGDAADGRRHHNVYDIHDEHDPARDFLLVASAEKGPGGFRQ